MIAIPTQPVALTIAGSDSSGGAGVQADLKTFAALDVHGTSAITAVTAQNRHGVSSVEMMPADLVASQIKMVAEEFSISAAKTGMLARRDIIEAISDAVRALTNIKLVVDPVMVATSGARLLADDSVQCLKDLLLPQALLITPNLDEAAVLLDSDRAKTREEMQRHATVLAAQTGTAVLVTGGHLDLDDDGAARVISDVLANNDEVTWFEAPAVRGTDTHGTGCTLSAAITANLAQGLDLTEAVRRAKAYVFEALMAARDPARGSTSS